MTNFIHMYVIANILIIFDFPGTKDDSQLA